MTSAPVPILNIESGNAGTLDTNGTGWFIGFSEWTRSRSREPQGSESLRHVPREAHLNGLCVKWFQHQPGDPNGEGKPISEGRTFSILAGSVGEFRIDFCKSADFEEGSTLVHTLREPGDFVIWDEGLYHRWTCIRPSSILTIRWSEKP